MEQNTGKPKVSACLMVKNEESNIERCLSSIRGMVDEIIVVDTGSIDRTMQIARSFGAVVYEHPWEHDFSKHRNQSIDHATGEWVFIVDADEELTYSDFTIEDLRKFLGKVPANICAIGITLQDMQRGAIAMQFNTTRFFRKGHIRYEGIVHNQPQVDGRAALLDSLVLKHYGYDLSPEQKEAKFVRTNALLQKTVQDDPNHPTAWFYLCQLYAEGGRNVKQAIEYGRKYLAQRDELVKKGDNHFNGAIYFTMFRNYTHLNMLAEAKDLLQQAVEYNPNDLDVCLAIVEYGILTNDAQTVLEGANQYLNLLDAYRKDPTLRGNRFIYSEKPEALCYVLLNLVSTCLTVGANNLGRFMKEVAGINPVLRDGMIMQLQQNLKNTGMPIELVIDKPEPGANVAPVYTTREFQPKREAV